MLAHTYGYLGELNLGYLRNMYSIYFQWNIPYRILSEELHLVATCEYFQNKILWLDADKVYPKQGLTWYLL